MAQMKSGKVLQEARERKGYDLTTVARRLRIRPDILRAIEAGDFSIMPPRGYTRNMVNAYARLLGLNPTEIVNMYLDEAYANQVTKARDAAPGSGFVMDNDYHHRPRLRTRTSQGIDGSPYDMTRRTTYTTDDTQPVATTRTRHLYDDRTRYSRDDYGVTRDRVERPGRSERDFLSHHSGYSSTNFIAPDSNAPRKGRGRDIHVGQTPMQYSAPRIPSFLQSRLAIVIAIAIVLIVVLVLVFVVGGSNRPVEDDVSKLPVSGITDTTGTDEQQEAESVQVEVAPTSSRVTYSVEKGDDCYIETFTDEAENAVGEMLSGPVQNTVEVTGTWTIATWSPDTIKVVVDGEEVQLKTNSELGGMYSYTVDFNQILAEWKSTHTSKDSQRQAAIATASNAASQEKDAAEDDEDTSTSASASSSASGSSGTGGDALYTQDANSASGYDDATGAYGTAYGYGNDTYGYGNGSYYGESSYGYADGSSSYGEYAYSYDDGTGAYGTAYVYDDGTGAYGAAYGYDETTGAYGAAYGYSDGTGTYYSYEETY